MKSCCRISARKRGDRGGRNRSQPKKTLATDNRTQPVMVNNTSCGNYLAWCAGLAHNKAIALYRNTLPLSGLIHRMWPYPRVLAHRGGGTLAPENTIAALRCGKSHGFSGVEFDVMLAGDGTPVLMHDPFFGRTIRGTGRVVDFSAGQLAAMDAGSWFGTGFRGEGVPTLKQALAFCLTEHIWPNIEIKQGNGCARQTGHAVAKVVQSFYASRPSLPAAGDAGPLLPLLPVMPLLSSFSLEALLGAQEAAPEIARGCLVDRVPPDWEHKLGQCAGIALHVGQRSLTKDQVISIREAGYAVFCYTVNDPHRAAELLAWGVDAFCTDRLDAIGADYAVASSLRQIIAAPA